MRVPGSRGPEGVPQITPGIKANAHDIGVFPGGAVRDLIEDLDCSPLRDFSRVNLFLRREDVIKRKERIVRLRICVDVLPDASLSEGPVIRRAVNFSVDEPGREPGYVSSFERLFAPENHLAVMVVENLGGFAGELRPKLARTS